MPQKSFVIGSVVFGILWGTFFYPPGPQPAKAVAVTQQLPAPR